MTTKEQDIPTILIIDVKTRIPDHYTIKYTPSMTIPGEKTKYVLFDPLVVYNSNVIMGGRIDELFYKNKFETMLNRIGMQSKRKKIEDNILKNNVQITLNKLFGSGNLFYIQNKPYTIISHKWDKKWSIENIPDFIERTGVRIEVELTLFEGKNPSRIDKLNANCETQFENIRRSYADFMGHEYRPIVSKKGGTKLKRKKRNKTRRVKK